MSEQEKQKVSEVAENFEKLPKPLQQRLNDIAYGMRLAKGEEAIAPPQAEIPQQE